MLYFDACSLQQCFLCLGSNVGPLKNTPAPGQRKEIDSCVSSVCAKGVRPFSHTLYTQETTKIEQTGRTWARGKGQDAVRHVGNNTTPNVKVSNRTMYVDKIKASTYPVFHGEPIQAKSPAFLTVFLHPELDYSHCKVNLF